MAEEFERAYQGDRAAALEKLEEHLGEPLPDEDTEADRERRLRRQIVKENEEQIERMAALMGMERPG